MTIDSENQSVVSINGTKQTKQNVDLILSSSFLRMIIMVQEKDLERKIRISVKYSIEDLTIKFERKSNWRLISLLSGKLMGDIPLRSLEAPLQFHFSIFSGKESPYCSRLMLRYLKIVLECSARILLLRFHSSPLGGGCRVIYVKIFYLLSPLHI